jgi:hypothetical protein
MIRRHGGEVEAMPAAEFCAAAQHLAAECGGHQLDPFTAERVTD